MSENKPYNPMAEEKEITVGSWIKTLILIMLPGFNIMGALVFSFAGKNEIKKNFYRAFLIISVVVTMISSAIAYTFVQNSKGIIETALQRTKNTIFNTQSKESDDYVEQEKYIDLEGQIPEDSDTTEDVSDIDDPETSDDENNSYQEYLNQELYDSGNVVTGYLSLPKSAEEVKIKTSKKEKGASAYQYNNVLYRIRAYEAKNRDKLLASIKESAENDGCKSFALYENKLGDIDVVEVSYYLDEKTYVGYVFASSDKSLRYISAEYAGEKYDEVTAVLQTYKEGE